MKLTHIVRKAGTVNCEVRFALTKAQMQIVRKHYGRPDGTVLTFAGRCEIYEQGNGWYAAFSMNDVVDGALRVITNIETALRLYAERLVKASTVTIAAPASAVQVLRDTARVRKYVIQKPFRYNHKVTHHGTHAT